MTTAIAPPDPLALAAAAHDIAGTMLAARSALCRLASGRTTARASALAFLRSARESIDELIRDIEAQP